MRKRILAALAAFGLIAVPASALAWTQEECPTPETHPDCLQYFPSPTPTPTVEPTASPTPEPTSTPTPVVTPPVEPSSTPTPDTKDDDIPKRGDGPTGPPAVVETPAPVDAPNIPSAGASGLLTALTGSGLYGLYRYLKR